MSGECSARSAHDRDVARRVGGQWTLRDEWLSDLVEPQASAPVALVADHGALHGSFEIESWLVRGRFVIGEVGHQIGTLRGIPRVVPAVHVLGGVIDQVVELAFRAVVHRPGPVGGTHETVAGDGADVHLDSEQFAVPLGEHPFEPTGVGVSVVDRKVWPCIQSWGASPAIVANVGARSTRPTGRVTTAAATCAVGAGRQMSGRCIRAST